MVKEQTKQTKLKRRNISRVSIHSSSMIKSQSLSNMKGKPTPTLKVNAALGNEKARENSESNPKSFLSSPMLVKGEKHLKIN